MRRWRGIALGLIALMAAACGQEAGAPQAGPPRPQELIVGKWRFADSEEQAMEFTADGALTMTGAAGQARYQLADDGTLVITPANGKPEKFKATVSADELTLADAEEQAEPRDNTEVLERETLKLKRAR